MALDDKTAPFAYHSVIHIKVVPANTNRGHIRYVPVISQFNNNNNNNNNDNNNNNNNDNDNDNNNNNNNNEFIIINNVKEIVLDFTTLALFLMQHERF